jgi:hypothetical protein
MESAGQRILTLCLKAVLSDTAECHDIGSAGEEVDPR